MTIAEHDKRFRKNVAAVIVNDHGQILACHRSDRVGAWQLPQGGMDENETAEQTLTRELLEEIGTNAIEIIGKLPDPIRYEWPEELYSRGYHGQEQTYFLVKLRPEAVINLAYDCENQEFDKFEWITATDFVGRLSAFKKEAYTTAIKKLIELHPGLIAE